MWILVIYNSSYISIQKREHWVWVQTMTLAVVVLFLFAHKRFFVDAFSLVLLFLLSFLIVFLNSFFLLPTKGRGFTHVSWGCHWMPACLPGMRSQVKTGVRFWFMFSICRVGKDVQDDWSRGTSKVVWWSCGTKFR